MDQGGSPECRCSLLSAREEKLLDDEGRVQVRLICNRCGAVLDSEVIHTVSPAQHPVAVEKKAAGGAS